MKTSISIIFIFLIIASCSNDDDQNTLSPINETLDILFNYGDQYIGLYQVHKIELGYSSLPPPLCPEPYIYESDTIISVSHGILDSTFHILYKDYYIDESGETNTGSTQITLRNDSIYYYYNSGGKCGTKVNLNGYKIE